nr:MAG TPA: hypothetical protein [Caudoviricetes sp.]
MGFADSLKAPLPSANPAAVYADQEEHNTIADGGVDENLAGAKAAAFAMGAPECDDDDCMDAPNDETDALIQKVGTPIVMKDALSAEECAQFKESVESDIAIQEGFYTERTIVKFDKNARMSQLRRVAALSIAKQANDPLFKKLNKVWKMERALESKIYKKYKSKADQRAKKLYANLRKSKSKTLANAAQKAVANA